MTLHTPYRQAQFALDNAGIYWHTSEQIMDFLHKVVRTTKDKNLTVNITEPGYRNDYLITINFGTPIMHRTYDTTYRSQQTYAIYDHVYGYYNEKTPHDLVFNINPDKGIAFFIDEQILVHNMILGEFNVGSPDFLKDAKLRLPLKNDLNLYNVIYLMYCVANKPHLFTEKIKDMHVERSEE